MGDRHSEAVPAGQWLLVTWQQDPAAPAAQGRHLVGVIREGCVVGRYWLRAYAAVPDQLILLFYPLEDTAGLLADFNALTGCRPEKIRVIKTDAGLERAATHVEQLPVHSHLALRAEDYPLSSVGWMRTLDGGQRASTNTPQGP